MNTSGRKIMLVDDNADFLWLTGDMLERAGYRVIQARDGEEALGLFKQDLPDLVLLDYRMPGMNGLQVASEMRRHMSVVPIIMITAYGEVASAVEAMKMGVYDYVTKPIDHNDLLFTLARALEKQDLVEEVERLRHVLNERASLYDLMGRSDPIKKLVRHVEKV
ncbi:MAG: response regulator, partial [Proteobacteria bacterium]|nr:response regulator [Pseudomonadota bacterium]